MATEVAKAKDANNFPGLARHLVADGLLQEEQARQALLATSQTKRSFLEYIISEYAVSPYRIAQTITRAYGLPFHHLTQVDWLSLPHIDEKIIKQHHILPLRQTEDRLVVGMADPTDFKAIDKLYFQLGIPIDIVIVEYDKLQDCIQKQFANRSDPKEFAQTAEALNQEVANLAPEITEANQNLVDEEPVVKYVHQLLMEALQKSASDIHLEVYETECRVRFRIDGILKIIASPPLILASRLVARIKILARMDIAERRLPQDGRFKIKLNDSSKTIDFRVSSCPTLFGEKMVLRILDASPAKLNIDQLGFEPLQKEQFLKAIDQPQGMILVTGPTGSGKTVTLYSALHLLNTPSINISTAEDPVEINLSGINQVNMNNKAGLNFSVALKSFLRQDPDVIMVGEIRDFETAEIAVKAAQTGHLVLSTLHTNSAAESLARLRNMGIEAFNLATSVSLVIAQRLLRRLCTLCREPVVLEGALLPIFQHLPSTLYTEGQTIYQEKGCDACQDGFKGRVGIYEMLPIDKNMSRLILEGATAMSISQAAVQNGHILLREAGLLKVLRGLTSLSEINRVTKSE